MAEKQTTAISFDFVDRPDIRFVLEDYFHQAIKARDAHAYLGAVVACGAVAEGVLTWALQRREPSARVAQKARKVKDRPIDSWNLEVLIDVAGEIGLISDDAQAIRDWRNLVHPYRRVKGSPRFDEALSLSAFRSVARIVRQTGGTVSIGSVVPAEMNFGWIIEGELAGCRGPAGPDDLNFLRKSNIRGLVRLAEATNEHVNRKQVATAGMEDCRASVPDFDVPKWRQLENILKFLSRMRAQRGPVAVSCGAGYGRTGTVAACWLIQNGKSAREALDYLKKVRPASAAEIEQHPNRRQLDFILEFERRVAHGRSLKHSVEPRRHSKEGV